MRGRGDVENFRSLARIIRVVRREVFWRSYVTPRKCGIERRVAIRISLAESNHTWNKRPSKQMCNEFAPPTSAQPASHTEEDVIRRWVTKELRTAPDYAGSRAHLSPKL